MPQPNTERDDILSLLAYALVYRAWQPDTIPFAQRRGYNIGALLVDPNDKPVAYDLNCVNSTGNATQHGEVRVITRYLEQTRSFLLDGFSLYVTLEPCIMCAGMITMTSIDRVVYGQHDVAYTKAFERLFDGSGVPEHPRTVVASPSTLSICSQLDAAYQDYLQTAEEKILAKFLASEKARVIFESAEKAFLGFVPVLDETKKILEQALHFYHST